MRILVTGGAGFIGSHLTEKLLSLGYKVKVIDNFSSGKIENIKHLYNISNSTFIKKDICDNIVDDFKDIDVVFHLAANISVSSSIKDPKDNHNVNVNGAFNVLDACRINKIKKFITASSASVYGSSQIEEFSPISPYGTSKVILEEYCKIFARCYGINTICLRYFNVYGSRQDPNSEYSAVIPKFIWSMLNNERPIINGDGEQVRSFIHVDDVVRANIKSLESNINGYTYMDIAGNESININSLFNKIKSNIGINLNPIYGPIKKGDIKYSFSRPDHAKRIIGFIPETKFDVGLKQTIEYFKNKN